MITVFTPAYNRAKFLPRVYESLCRQTYRDFEWVIVDDGSTDGTKQLFHLNDNLNENVNWAAQEKKVPVSVNVDFPIRYFYQENGGKHRAINRGVKEARGELFFIVDSDDYIVDDSLMIIHNTFLSIKGDNSFGGIGGLLIHSDGTIIGNKPNKSPLDCTQVEYWCKYKIRGDKTEVFRTDVLKEIPFPEYEGEKFCPEEYEWLRIASKYKMRYINSVLAVRDYLDGGLTSKIVKIRMNSPKASVANYALFNTFDIPLKRKLRNAINYWRFRLCLSSNLSSQYILPRLRWYWNCVMPIGWIMHKRDSKFLKQ